MNGINSTIIAYGSTGSGKTFTILGDEEVEKEIMSYKINDSNEELKQSWGILPNSIENIFELIEEKRLCGEECKLKCSYIEVYNEEIYDLLSKVPNSNAKIVVKSYQEPIFCANDQRRIVYILSSRF